MVSAVITTHNRSDLLTKAINSIKSQTYKDIEIIVVDDASDDNTPNICNNMNDVKYIRIDEMESKGGNYARNLGIINSTGKYIAFLDDDDQWYPSKIDEQLKVQAANPNVGLIYTGLHVDTGVKKLNYDIFFDEEMQGNLISARKYWKPFCTTSSMFIKRSILEDVGMFDENVRYWQEYELALRLIQKCEVKLINKPLVKYRKYIKDKKTLTNNYDKWEESVNYINRKHAELFDKLDEEEKKLKLEYCYKEAAFRASAIGNKELMREYYKKAYKLTNKLEYFIRYKTNLSRQDTVYMEIILRKISNAFN